MTVASTSPGAGLAARLGAVRGRTAALLRLLNGPLSSYYLVLGCSMLLLALGLLMVLSASSISSYEATGSSFTLFQQQAIWAGIGLPVMAVAAWLPPHAYRLFVYPVAFTAVLALTLTLVPGLGVESGGATRWLDLGFAQVQPSEPAKLALVLWGSDLLARKEKLGLLTEWRHLLLPLLPGAGLLVLLVMFGSDLGTTIVLLSIFLVLLWVVGAPGRLFAGMVGLMALLVSILVLVEPYRLERLTVFLDPFSQPLHGGYQSVHGIYAIATGGLFGVGLGASREKWSYLPHAETDFIFAIIGEELGLMGTLVVLALFGLLGYAGFRIGIRVKDPFIRLAAAGTTAWLVVQALVNIGAVIGMVPVTGIPLPLVSYGGSALLPTLAALGMLLSFTRHDPVVRRALAARGPGPAPRVLRWLGFRRR